MYYINENNILFKVESTNFNLPLLTKEEVIAKGYEDILDNAYVVCNTYVKDDRGFTLDGSVEELLTQLED